MVQLGMTSRRRRLDRPSRRMALTVLGLALTACACSSTKQSSAASSTAPTSTAPASVATKGTVTTHSSRYGTILTNAAGRTLYMLTADTSTASSCTGACAGVWPPLVVTGSPTAASGVTAGLLSTITRADGSHQVTYDGHPLYTYAPDTAAGQVTGEGIKSFGGTWYVMSPAGQPVTSASSSAGTPTTSGGYSY